MVLLLQSRPAMTAAELAHELQVSERTVTRDAQALSEAGIPVYSERGRAGGYRLVGGYRTGLTGLARDEAEALFLSGLPSALREMGLADAASAARLKVSAALLPSLRDARRRRPALPPGRTGLVPGTGYTGAPARRGRGGVGRPDDARPLPAGRPGHRGGA